MYFSHKETKEGLCYIDEMLKYAVQSKKIYIINLILDHSIDYWIEHPDELEPKILTLKSSIDSLLETQQDKERNAAYFYSEMIKLTIYSRRELKKEAIELGKKLIDVLNNLKLEPHWILNFKVWVFQHLLINDKESIDQGEILKIKKAFTSITDLIGTDRQFEVYYTEIEVYVTIVQIFQVMGITCDSSTQTKYAELLKDNKLTFIKFFTSLENYTSLSCREQQNKWMEYLDELEAHELNYMRLKCQLQIICLNFQNQNNISMGIGCQKLQEFISYLNQHRNKYTYIKELLTRSYQIILQLTQNDLDPKIYLNFAEDYIELGLDSYENRQLIWQTMNDIIF